MTTETEIIFTESGQDEKTRAEVYRNLRILYGSQTGRQALDRQFGMDSSIPGTGTEQAKVLMTAEFVKKTEQYEPRARVKRVDWVQKGQDGSLTARVVVELV